MSANSCNQNIESNAKINMDAVIIEFKERLAYEKRCFHSLPKHEQREIRSERKKYNQYVEQVIADWHPTKDGVRNIRMVEFGN